jgi:hypothetical protein
MIYFNRMLMRNCSADWTSMKHMYYNSYAPVHIDILFKFMTSILSIHRDYRISQQIDGGIFSVIHPNGTITVEISAKWDESEFDNKIRLKKYRKLIM